MSVVLPRDIIKRVSKHHEYLVVGDDYDDYIAGPLVGVRRNT